MKRIGVFSFYLALCLAAATAKPNIVLVITDDQGYGDVACHGNPVIKTPHLDALAAESISLTDYHVAPTCSPTRAALLTGHWTNRTGVWHTVNGRSMLRANEVTLGRYLMDAGYETGMFGKWHLGDNYPYRPEERGFKEVYRHGGGGVGQTPDVWDNAYFDGGYFHNGKIVSAKGFCTDVFFDQGKAFISRCVQEEKPFFAYICTNAPHGPLHCPEKYLELYPDVSPAVAAFFGMITNIDDNVGALRAHLQALGVEKDTLFIFTTDNGTANGEKIFNAGMRGKKGSAYDGGHRVPFFLHWPAKGWDQGRPLGVLSHAVDVVPTLLDLAGVEAPPTARFDGLSLKPWLAAGEDETVDWPERFLITDSQRVRDPIKWKTSAVMSEQYRLINGEELYDIVADPGQRTDVAAAHPDQVKRMREFYEAWWLELEPTFAQTTEIVLGHRDHAVVSLTGHDWIQKSLPPWNQRHIRNGHMSQPKRGEARAATARHEGHWAVKVVETGEYEVEMRRWPVEANQPIRAALPPGADVPGATKAFRAVEGKGLDIVRATLRVNGKSLGESAVEEAATQVRFQTRLEAGSHELSPVFHTATGDEVGAYYAVVRRVP